MSARPWSIVLPVVALALLQAPLSAVAQAPATTTSTASDREDLAVTVYNDNLGLIKDTRRLQLRGGTLPLRFSDVAAQIDATSVSFRPLGRADALDVLEQNYEYDLITPAKLMEKYVGREVQIRTPPEGDRPGQTLKATLISTNDGYVYRIGDQIYLQPPGQVILPDMPADLVAKPSLIWLLNVKHAGAQPVEASYMTGGMSWQADYVVVSSPDNRRGDLTGWVTIKNESGASYPDARLTLVAGEVHRAAPPQPQPMYEARMMKPQAAGAPSQFTEQGLFEYHSYDLKRRATIKNQQTKQLTLLGANGVETRKVYVFDGSRPRFIGGENKPKVQVMLEFWNTQRNGLGMPLPKGRVRVYQEDANKKLQFIGEDAIDHTPKDEKVRVEMGNAFDIVGERRQTNYRALSDTLKEYTFEVTLRNHKNEATLIDVVEHVYGDWQVTKQSHKFDKLSATEIDFPVRVPANGEAKLTYTIQMKY